MDTPILKPLLGKECSISLLFSQTYRVNSALLARNLEKQLCCQCEIVSFSEVVNFWPSLTFFSHEIYLAWILHTFLWVGELHVF